MKLFSIETANFKIDGGAYFGVVPKMMWEKKYPADENNMCNSACRSLLIDVGDRVFLIDTGIGTKHDADYWSSYFVDFSNDLETNLQKLGYTNNDITDVILTHLHFDHCGGTINFNQSTKKLELAFPNANVYISKLQWDNAFNPHYREKSSYPKENFEFLADNKRLIFVEKDTRLTEYLSLRLFSGHTEGLMLPVIKTKTKTVFFAGDLIPASVSIPLAWVSAYDVFPLKSIEEKIQILNEAVEKGWILFFQHDYYNECCDLELTPRGVRAKNTFSFKQFFS